MALPSFAAINVGDQVITLENPPISRTTLALYAGASGDHNPMHIDLDYARAAGEQDVFAHGMLSMAYLGRSVTTWVPQSALRSFFTQFKAITRIGEKITCIGKIADKIEADGEQRVKLELTAVNEKGEVKASAEAIVSLS